MFVCEFVCLPFARDRNDTVFLWFLSCMFQNVCFVCEDSTCCEQLSLLSGSRLGLSMSGASEIDEKLHNMSTLL